eukprot:jgi/Chrzof1/9510/Cz04g05240.t1
MPLEGANDEPSAAYTVSPVHVLLVGAGALGSGALATAALSYKQAEKQLAAEGVDPAIRRHILPHALKALAASLVMTGCAAAAGFYMMKATGLIQSDEARLPSTQQAWQIFMGKPKDRQQVHHLGGAQQ